MSYPTVNFLVTSAEGGVQPIAQASDTQMHPLGKIVRAQDATYGEIEAVYLLGVASTAKGDAVCYRSDTGVTVRAVHGGATSVGPVAVAMADTVAAQYGWYAISGSVPVKAGTVAANGQVYLTSTAGQLDDAVVSGDEIGGMLFKSADSAGFATAQLSMPSISGAGGSSGTNTGDVTLANVGSTPDAKGATLSGQVLTLQPADSTRPGLVTAGAQTIAGVKTLASAPISANGYQSATANQGITFSSVHTVLASGAGGNVYIQNAAGTTRAEFAPTQFMLFSSLLLNPVTTNVDAYVQTVPDGVIFMTHDAARTVTIFAASSVGAGAMLTVVDSSGSSTGGNTITIAPVSGTINGGASVVITPGTNKAVVLVSDGANWFVLSRF